MVTVYDLPFLKDLKQEYIKQHQHFGIEKLTNMIRKPNIRLNSKYNLWGRKLYSSL